MKSEKKKAVRKREERDRDRVGRREGERKRRGESRD